MILLYSCSRRHTPQRTAELTETNPKKTDSAIIKKKAFTPRQKDIMPNVIVDNDQAAHKSIDGRLYYDLLGHRYWKNYKDGKYYLFNQKMYDNPAFKPPK